ncbi:hypothetical protein ACIHFE_08325 [Streptomyces sp. NPDC052396]|uniref:hypothetical protein n=1 Tax=Streptomyces sp. NPDC052396 TaxID=3365689 RepID=UPI0037CE3461
MRARTIRRGAGMALAAAALTTTMAVAGTGTASASTGGGCAGPTYKNVCISDHNNGRIGADAYLNFGNIDSRCYMDFGVFDKTSWSFATSQAVSCQNGYQHLGIELTNPAQGHDYVGFVHVHWTGDSNSDGTDSAVLHY